MLIETWIAALITICVFLSAIISGLGWIIEGERLAKAERLNRKLIAENGRLYKIIEHMNGIQTINAADAFHKKGERNV